MVQEVELLEEEHLLAALRHRVGRAAPHDPGTNDDHSVSVAERCEDRSNRSHLTASGVEHRCQDLFLFSGAGIKGIKDIFTACSDSSAATVEWALAELINHPHILKKLREEIDNVVGKDRVIEESDIPNLPYLHAVVKETLRLHPAAPLATRVSSKM